MMFRLNEIIIRKILFRKNEIIFRLNKILFRKNEIIFRLNKILFRNNEMFRKIYILLSWYETINQTQVFDTITLQNEFLERYRCYLTI